MQSARVTFDLDVESRSTARRKPESLFTRVLVPVTTAISFASIVISCAVADWRVRMRVGRPDGRWVAGARGHRTRRSVGRS
jgi:hypothetical protein